MKSQVIIVIVTLFGYVCAANYNRGYGGVDEKAAGNGHRRYPSGGYEGGKNYPRKPYRTEYTIHDGKGNSHFRSEYTDEFGAVSGSYGYEDASGLFRVVDYVADARGFRANVRTNEPGATNIQTMPEKPSSAGGTGSNSPSAEQVTGAVINTICNTGTDFNAAKCLTDAGAG